VWDELLKGHPLTPNHVVVNGYVYEVETGHLRRPLGRLAERVNSASQMRVEV
jgi:carbonic anhydrase